MFGNYADEETPTPNNNWKNLSNEQRVDLVKKVTKKSGFFEIISVSTAHENGQVFVKLREDFGAAKRGNLLLDYEEYIKEYIDKGLVLWCEPLGDKNSLRNLRGIQIRS